MYLKILGFFSNKQIWVKNPINLIRIINNLKIYIYINKKVIVKKTLKKYNLFLINKKEEASTISIYLKKNFFYLNKKSNIFINFSNTIINKYLNLFIINSYIVMFLRKSKIFNKGRYSRNRQFYRTGVY